MYELIYVLATSEVKIFFLIVWILTLFGFYFMKYEASESWKTVLYFSSLGSYGGFSCGVLISITKVDNLVGYVCVVFISVLISHFILLTTFTIISKITEGKVEKERKKVGEEIFGHDDWLWLERADAETRKEIIKFAKADDEERIKMLADIKESCKCLEAGIIENERMIKKIIENERVIKKLNLEIRKIRRGYPLTQANTGDNYKGRGTPLQYKNGTKSRRRRDIQKRTKVKCKPISGKDE